MRSAFKLEEYFVREADNLYMYEKLRKALKILLNPEYLDLNIDSKTAHYGLRFYITFNRLDAVRDVIPVLKSDNCISLKANIIPLVDDACFDNMDRTTIIPFSDLRAVAAVIVKDKVNDFLRELKVNYHDVIIYDTVCSCSKDILDTLLNSESDAFNLTPIYEIGICSIDRSNNPIRGKIVAYDSQLLWIQSINADVPPTFFIIPLKYISFITK